MKRAATGTYETSSTAGETVRAFVPQPLPPAPPLQLEGRVRERLDAALIALGRLDGVSSLLPDVHLFLYTYVRKEAVLSSQIDGAERGDRAAVSPDISEPFILYGAGVTRE